MSTFQTINPANQQVIKTYEHLSDDEAGDVVRTCHEAFLEWRDRPL